MYKSEMLAQHAKRKSSYLNGNSMPPGNLSLRKLIASRYICKACHALHMTLSLH
jgi:hypothetical protein